MPVFRGKQKNKIWIEISQSALESNYKTFRSLVTPSSLMAVVKANAYGHGLKETINALSSVDPDWFGVDNIDEALAIRALGYKQIPILILGYTPLSRLREAVMNGVSLTVYQEASVKALARVATIKHPARVHLKIETGLIRQGLETEEIPSFLKLLKQYKHVWLEGASTHFANIEDRKDPTYAMMQLSRFEDALLLIHKFGFMPEWQHTTCSAAAILFPQTRFNLVRLGISLYGLWPSEKTRQCAKEKHVNIELRPALALKTLVAQVKIVKRGQTVGYGCTECMTRDTKVAVLPIGYADGFDRVGMSHQGQVLIKETRCRIIGRVCMNMCMVDVTDVKGKIEPEDEVVLIGSQGDEIITVEDLARKSQTINYEIVARLSPLIPRILI